MIQVRPHKNLWAVLVYFAALNIMVPRLLGCSLYGILYFLAVLFSWEVAASDQALEHAREERTVVATNKIWGSFHNDV